MKRRLTILRPASETNALFSLDPQPFSRRIVSLSVQTTSAGSVSPRLLLADVEGNVLCAWVAVPDVGTNRWTFSSAPSDGYVAVNGAVPPAASGVVFYHQPIPDDLELPPSNLLSLQLFGTAPGDTISTCAIVTEDDYPLDWPE